MSEGVVCRVYLSLLTYLFLYDFFLGLVGVVGSRCWGTSFYSEEESRLLLFQSMHSMILNSFMMLGLPESKQINLLSSLLCKSDKSLQCSIHSSWLRVGLRASRHSTGSEVASFAALW